MRILSLISILLFCRVLTAQETADAWMKAQLGSITWQESYQGVLADYHPITIILASDKEQIAGYLMHEGDHIQHRLIGDWSASGDVQLQERDAYDRLTGYLTGAVNPDQVIMKWISADQNRVFDVKAFPSHLIKIKNFKPADEWIEVAGPPTLTLAVQKMDYGIVSGMANYNGIYARFEGNCLDGTCSIWSTVIPDENGNPLRIQMRQRDQAVYKVMLNDKEYKGDIRFGRPLALRTFDNSSGFLDFVYPRFESKTFDAWLGQKVDSIWQKEIRELNQAAADPDHPGRLTYRSSGWIEVLSEGPTYVSGMITFIHPDQVHRETFVWLKKEDDFIAQSELLNSPAEVQRVSASALASTSASGDEAYDTWLKQVGFTMVVPTPAGALLSTPFDVVFGDEMMLRPLEESKAMIKKKYWKYFGW